MPSWLEQAVQDAGGGGEALLAGVHALLLAAREAYSPEWPEVAFSHFPASIRDESIDVASWAVLAHRKLDRLGLDAEDRERAELLLTRAVSGALIAYRSAEMLTTLTESVAVGG